MPFNFTEDGLQIETYQEIYDRKVEGYKSIYGNDIDLEPNTPDGQRIAIESKNLLDLQTQFQSLYSSLDPDFAMGAFLDVILKLNGTYRNPATRSQAQITLDSNSTRTLPSGFVVKDSLDQKWETVNDYNLVVGSNTVSVFAQQWGSIAAAPNTITEAVTVLIGISNITNPLAATVGEDEETDTAVRIKRNRSLGNPAYSVIGSLIAKISLINGVTDCTAYENKTNFTDARGIPPHSTWLIVKGGDNAEIAKTYVFQKTAGCNTFGATSTTYTEEILRPDGNTFTINHTMNFSRPTDVNVYVRLNVQSISSDPLDLDLIKQKIAEKTLSISEILKATDLYEYAYNAGRNFTAYGLDISTDSITWVNTMIEPNLDQILVIDESNIAITEIP